MLYDKQANTAPAVPVQTMPLNQVTLDFSTLSADDTRSAILCFADDFSWETVAREMIKRMSVDDARDFAEHFHKFYIEDLEDDELEDGEDDEG